MNSLRELYRIGNGPSSSHTMGPFRMMKQFVSDFPQAASFRVTLYGSLAATGKGHLTDIVLRQATADRSVEIIWKPDQELPHHSNGMFMEALDAVGQGLGNREDYSIGGGALASDPIPEDLYPEKNIVEVLSVCEENGESFWEYISRIEGEILWSFLSDVWEVMKKAIENGLESKGKLPGDLNLPRKAHSFYRKSAMMGAGFKEDALIIAYAYAVAEENASSGRVVTAPTCGSSGVLPAVLFSLQNRLRCSDEEILRAIATAGLFGNGVKSNASISGACVGCQGEVGTACAMAAAAATQLQGGSLRQIEYAAEMGLEHHFGLTCDPVNGLVQIPCIERNAHAALRSMDCSHFALLSDGLHRISFDDAVSVLWETGQALPRLYRETSTGGLAKIYKKRISEQETELMGENRDSSLRSE